jgi:hypothetical protein
LDCLRDLAHDFHRVDFLRSEKSANRDIFVNIFPMDSGATADEPPVGALLRRGAKKAWEPCQRRRYATTVHESDDQFVIGARNIDSVCNRFTG